MIELRNATLSALIDCFFSTGLLNSTVRKGHKTNAMETTYCERVLFSTQKPEETFKCKSATAGANVKINSKLSKANMVLQLLLILNIRDFNQTNCEFCK